MSEYTLAKSDVVLENREWQAGSYCVQRDGKSIALFIFDHPEAISKIFYDEAAALAAAKSFMAVDDLVAELQNIASGNWDGMTGQEFMGWAKSRARHTLEKAGVK